MIFQCAHSLYLQAASKSQPIRLACVHSTNRVLCFLCVILHLASTPRGIIPLQPRIWYGISFFYGHSYTVVNMGNCNRGEEVQVKSTIIVATRLP